MKIKRKKLKKSNKKVKVYPMSDMAKLIYKKWTLEVLEDMLKEAINPILWLS